MYTSGSTGNPKGVIVENRNIAAFQRTTKLFFGFESNDIILANTISTFDISVLELICSLLSGMGIQMLSEHKILELDSYLKLISKGVTILQITPSKLKSLFEDKNYDILNSLKILMIGGESFDSQLYEHLKSFDSCKVYNVYGPTETTIWSSAKLLNNSSLTIGKPLPNESICIVSINNEILQKGAKGEICIGGTGISRGYLNQIELTNEKFIAGEKHTKERLYKTGDLGMILENDELQFIGRIDNQVKIRGLRIELEEIVSFLTKHPAVVDAIVCMKEKSENQYICAYLIGETVDNAELCSYLEIYLPKYMIPSYFVWMDSFPLNINGKIDKSLLAIPDLVIDSSKISPSNHTSIGLAKLWKDILMIPENYIYEDSNFFELGGHSLNVTSLISRVLKTFNVQLKIGDIFSNPTLCALADKVSNLKIENESAIEPIEKREYYAASSQQIRMYFLQLKNLDSVAYNIPSMQYLDESIDVTTIKIVFEELIRRQEGLRTSFQMINETVVQRISDHIGIAIEEYSVTTEGELETINHEFVRPFDLSIAPLIRVAFIKFNSKSILLTDMHHILGDWLSNNILVKEFTDILAKRKLPKLQLQYKEYTHWINADAQIKKNKDQEKYWVNRFSDDLPILQLPFDYPRPSEQSFEGAKVQFHFSKEEMALLKKVSEQYDITLYMTVLFIYNIFLSKISGQEDIVIGTTIAARRNADLDNVVGMFVNTVAIRNFPSSSLSVREFIVQTKQNVLDAFENQDYQFEELVEKVYLRRDNSRNPIFDVMFNFLNRKKSDIEFDDACESYIHKKSTSKFDLNLKIVDEKKVLLMELEYCTRLFREETINRFIDLLKGIIKPICENPQKKISEISILNGDKRKEKIDFINQPLRIQLHHNTIQSKLREVFTKYKNKEAIICGERTLTYRELERKTNEIAVKIIAQNIAEQSFVGIYIEDRFDQILHCIGVLKARCVFVPFNTKLPFNRNLEMIKMARIKAIFIDENSSTNFNHPYFKDEEVNLLKTNNSEIGIDNQNINFNGLNYSPDDMLYINYTSGTTGKPKGIIGRNESLLHFIEWELASFKIDDSCKAVQVSNPGFDPFLRDVFIPLCSGGTVCVLDDYDIMFDGNRMLDWVETSKINLIHFVPSMFKIFCSGSLSPDRLKYMKSILLAGEKLVPSELKDWYEIFGERIQLANLYGPTETTQSKAYYPITKQDVFKNEMPVGKPFEGVRFIVLDKNLDFAPVGVTGEIYIRTPYRALGYVNDPELNNQYFIQNPFSNDPQDILYKSGDLGKELGDGNFVIQGRNDHQVKIRGFRIELDEIQGLILKYNGIKEVLVVDYDDNSGSKFLCAYIVSKIKIDPSGLRQYLLDYIPDYMVPSYFTQLEKMPLTSNGKVNRKNLPLPEISLGRTYVAPSNEFEARLAGLWSDVLNVPKNEISIDINFFEIGGHSLKAIILIAKIHKEFNVKVPLAEIFKKPTIKLLAEHIKKFTVDEFFTIKNIEEKEYYPLSSAQKRIFFLQQTYHNSLRYNMPEVLMVNRYISKVELGLVVQQIVDSHESFRTSFELREDQPVQRIKKSVKVDIEFNDIDSFNIEDIHLKFVRPFELSRTPLLRVGVFYKDQNSTYIITDIHHIISDGISRTILKKEFQDLLDGKELTKKRIRYKDYLTWQFAETQNQDKQKLKDFWLNEFSGEIPVLDLPTDFNRPAVFQNEGASISFFINESDTRGLRNITSTSQGTLFMTLLSIYTILMSKLSGQEDIIIGTPTSGRPHVDLHNIIGIFVNTLALRNFPKGEKRFIDFLEEVKAKTLASFENENFQFEELVELLKPRRDTSRNPLFDVTFTMQNQIEKSDIKVSNSDELTKAKRGSTKFDISLTSVEFESCIYCNVGYSTKIFHEDTIIRFIQYFKSIVSQMCLKPNTILSEIDILSDSEKQKLLYEFNNNISRCFKNKTISELFEDQVKKVPNKIAIAFEDRKLTYLELNNKSNHLASYIRKNGAVNGEIVALIFETSIEMIVGMLAVLKSGAAYLPINVELPQNRINFILKDADCSLILTNMNYNQESFQGQSIIDIDGLNFEGKCDNLENKNRPTDPIYVIYTSGTTGGPKGVIIKQENLLNYITWFNNIASLNSDYKTALVTSYSFDLGYTAIYSSLLNGCELHLLNKGFYLSVNKFANYIISNSINYLKITPSLYSLIVEFSDVIKKLQLVVLGGEAINVNDVAKSLTLNNCMTIINHYGPTEATVGCIAYKINEKNLENFKNKPVIGTPISNTKVYILDNKQKPIPIEIKGELCISGEGLALGYLNNPELTSNKFIDHPFDTGEKLYKTGDLASWLSNGSIRFYGRNDHQVKIRGFRIELGEIEKTLLKHEDIVECVVVVQNINGEKYVCAYLVTSFEVKSSSLSSFLSNELPDYMIPHYFVMLDILPLNHNGKIDYSALPLPEPKIEADFTLPSNEIEEKLLNIWSEILNITPEKISVNANFFDLGGHSLKAVMLASKMNKVFQKSVTILDVFKFSTIRELCQRLGGIVVNNSTPIQFAEKKDYYPLSSVQKRLYFMQELYPKSTSYNIPLVKYLDKNIDQSKLENVIRCLIKRHESLRTVFINVNGEIYQRIHEDIDLTIEQIETSKFSLDKQLEAFVKPFNLNKYPLIRAGLFNVKGEMKILVIDLHHIICDGVSNEILMQEFNNIYNNNKLNIQKIQYKDYSDWQLRNLGSRSIINQLEFWKEQLSGNISRLDLPSDFKRPSIFTQKGAYYRFTLASKDADKLKGMCVECNATLYMKVLAILNILFYKHTGQEDIIIGTGVSGRNQYDFQNVIGMFVNTLPMRNHPTIEKSFEEFLNEVKTNSIRTLNNQDVQLEIIVEELNIQKDLSRNPLFDVTLVVQNHRQNGIDTKSNSFDDSGIIETSNTSGSNSCKFDLTFIVQEIGDEILVNIEYYADLFSLETILFFEKHIRNIIHEITLNPKIKISDIDILNKKIKNDKLLDTTSIVMNEGNSMEYSDEAEFEF
jgi:tyrocidine synthetase-3